MHRSAVRAMISHIPPGNK